METVDGLDTTEGVKWIEEGILLPLWAVLVKLDDSQSVRVVGRGWSRQMDCFVVGEEESCPLKRAHAAVNKGSSQTEGSLILCTSSTALSNTFCYFRLRTRTALASDVGLLIN
jgi:hypothetical protein